MSTGHPPQLAPGCPHLPFPAVPGALLAITGKISPSASRLDRAPGAFESQTRLVEVNGAAGGRDAADGGGIEAAVPFPLVDSARHAGALTDRADPHITVVDMPLVLAEAEIAAAGEVVGHRFAFRAGSGSGRA
jgi:hypothetical protein